MDKKNIFSRDFSTNIVIVQIMEILLLGKLLAIKQSGFKIKSRMKKAERKSSPYALSVFFINFKN